MIAKAPRPIKRLLLVDPPTAIKRHHCPSLGLSCLRSALLKAGFAVDSVNLIRSRNPLEDLDAAMSGVDAVGITSNAASARWARILGTHIRERNPDLPIIMGGPFPTVAPGELLPEHADWVALGEGEKTLVELLENGSPENIAGTAYWDPEAKAVKINQPRGAILDLDSLPFPVWLRRDTETYYLNSGNRNPIGGLMTSRGCPYDCVNCTKHVFGHRFRARSPENVLDEVKYLSDRYKIRECFIWDDAFNINIPRAKAILRGLAELNLGIRFAFPNAFRADFADEEFFRLMKAAGVYWIAIAIESFSQEVLDGIGKKLDLNRALDAVAWANKYGINTTAYFMLGLPGDTPETLEDTVRKASRLPVDQIMFFIATPFPGSRFHDIVTREGQFFDDPGSAEIHFEGGKALHQLPGLPGELVERAYKKANRKFYFNFRTVLRFIRRRVRSPRDVAYLVKNAWIMLFRGRLW